ncbi:hypothetical protein CL684_01020 [Candidatus Campbellbacteria bacterium]|nr:hypothetical protein [Candidatus Campbellbacteria bacterium]|tara:strand:+ start:5132 stop:5731 length:600 start_codon:yes stop_codon:yes gene_type:complete
MAITYQKLNSDKKGFVILFAVLISSLILLMAVGIFNVTQKSSILSSSSRESQLAFYAADATLECALYVDLKGIGSPNPVTPFSPTPAPGSREPRSFSCGNGTVNSYHLSESGGTDLYTTPYVMRYLNQEAEGGCAYALIEKNLRSNLNPALVHVRVTAVGFNVCVDDNGTNSGDMIFPDFNDPRLVERRISITYTQDNS